MNSNSFYGVNYHLYGGSTDGSADGYANDLTSSANVFPGKPHFMTEFGFSDMIQTACLIHDCLTTGQDSGFNYWSLVWPGTGGGLIQIENPFSNQSTWTNAPPGTPTQSHGWWYAPSYWAMKHFSYFVQPGYRRVSAVENAGNVRVSAYLSPDGLRLVNVNAVDVEDGDAGKGINRQLPHLGDAGKGINRKLPNIARLSGGLTHYSFHHFEMQHFHCTIQF